MRQTYGPPDFLEAKPETHTGEPEFGAADVDDPASESRTSIDRSFLGSHAVIMAKPAYLPRIGGSSHRGHHIGGHLAVVHRMPITDGPLPDLSLLCIGRTNLCTEHKCGAISR